MLVYEVDLAKQRAAATAAAAAAARGESLLEDEGAATPEVTATETAAEARLSPLITQ